MPEHSRQAGSACGNATAIRGAKFQLFRSFANILDHVDDRHHGRLPGHYAFRATESGILKRINPAVRRATVFIGISRHEKAFTIPTAQTVLRKAGQCGDMIFPKKPQYVVPTNSPEIARSHAVWAWVQYHPADEPFTDGFDWQDTYTAHMRQQKALGITGLQ